MTSLDDVFVADAVSHGYNLTPENYRVDSYAEAAVEMIKGMELAKPAAYQRTPETLLTDWTAEDAANVMFRESQTDFSVFHPQSITVFHDGLTATEKAKEITERHPTRTAALASVDLIGMDDPHGELTRQVEEFDPHGVKVYPSYWDDDGHQSFKMDDPEQAFPLWEHCVDLGLDVVAIHKALPFGAVPMDPYKVSDIDEAAASFPDLTFEIVHGGLTFAEETGWQIARFPNVYVNLEITGVQVKQAPKSFLETMEELLWAGGKAAVDKIIWGTGAPHFHPQPLIEAFWEFDFPEMEFSTGTFEITKEDKEKMLGKNLVEAHNLDLDRIQKDIADDEFSDVERVEEPWSTTEFEVVA